MTKAPTAILANWRYDLPSSLVVFLVALPLCLGVALASGAPLFSGLIAGVVGGIVVGILSKSPLSVSGPAAGLTVIVFAAIQQLPTFEAFLMAVCLAGAIQIALGIAKAGIIGDFIPSSVITGMLAAIGLILIMKQLPHALGYDVSVFGGESLHKGDVSHMLQDFTAVATTILPGAALIAILSLGFLFWWDKKQPQLKSWMRYIPGPLVVVAFGITANWLLGMYYPVWSLQQSHLVAVPVAESAPQFFSQFRIPDFAMITNMQVWGVAFTLALVASIESLLSIEAIDKLDPYKRVTPTNRELMAQGVGNITSGLIGGLPVTSVIVRSSANVASGGRSKLATILHGMLLLLSVVVIPHVLNLIPLSALAAVLIAVGYKLTKPAIFRKKYEKGIAYFLPFIVTVSAIVLSDLLLGVLIGVVVGVVFILIQNFRSAIMCVDDGENHLIRFKKDLFFLHKYELKRTLSGLPNNCSVLLDFTRILFIDKDNLEIINDFIIGASYRNISVTTRHNPDIEAPKLVETLHAAA